MKHILRLSVLLAIVFIICKDMVLILNLNNMNMIEKFYQSIKKFEIPFILYRKKNLSWDSVCIGSIHYCKDHLKIHPVSLLMS